MRLDARTATQIKFLKNHLFTVIVCSDVQISDPVVPFQYCVSIFRLMYAECIGQMRGRDVTLKAQTQYVTSRSYGNMTADEFQALFVYESRASPSNALPRREQFPFKLRFDLGPSAEDQCAGAGERGYLHVRVTDTCLALPMSAVTAVTELIEDEVVNPGICMRVDIMNLGLTLNVSSTDSVSTRISGMALWPCS